MDVHVQVGEDADNDLAAQELAEFEGDQVALNFKKLQNLDISKLKYNVFTPRVGPFGPERNQEIFKALLYLMDAEKKKRPDLMDSHDAMLWYYARKQTLWKTCLFVACFLYVLVSLIDAPAFEHLHTNGKDWYEVFLEVICNIIFAVDIYMQGRGKGHKKVWRNTWTRIFALCLIFDFFGVIWQGLRVLQVTGIVRAYPIVYYSKRARNAMINYSKTLPSVMLWIGLELFVVVIYACIGVVMYAHKDKSGSSGQNSFQSFSNAFISLYSLSLTVNDPDIYLPYYNMNFGHILIFASFMIITFFMIHNIILSRIFQIYSNKLKETAKKRKDNRSKALFLAFEALDDEKSGMLPKELLAYVLKRLRPKYSQSKIETLMKHSNKRNPNQYNFDQFEVLMASLDDRVHKIRRTDFYSAWGQRCLDVCIVGHLLIVLCSIVDYWNFFYTVGFWVLIWIFRVVFAADVIYRMRRSGGVKYFMKDKFNAVNVVAVLFSIIALGFFLHGIVHDRGSLALDPYTPEKKLASLSILFASCCDIGRIFARVPEYSALLIVFNKLFSAFTGQATVVFTMMHVFCYMGMFIFGGRIRPDQLMWAQKGFAGNLYYLLNFNTYKEGMITLFMLLIVNNWNIIAANFVAVTSGASYLYFMGFQITVVTIGLNCVTSFFIGNLSNKLEEELENQKELKRKRHEDDRKARSHGINPLLDKTVKYKIERRVSSDDLMLPDEEPVGASEYRALLDVMTLEQGERTGYCFIRENEETDVNVIQRNPYFAEIIDRYGGDKVVLDRVKALFKEEAAKKEGQRERGELPDTCSVSSFTTKDRLSGSVLCTRIYVLTEGDLLIAFCRLTDQRGPPSASGDRLPHKAEPL